MSCLFLKTEKSKSLPASDENCSREQHNSTNRTNFTGFGKCYNKTLLGQTLILKAVGQSNKGIFLQEEH